MSALDDIIRELDAEITALRAAQRGDGAGLAPEGYDRILPLTPEERWRTAYAPIVVDSGAPGPLRADAPARAWAYLAEPAFLKVAVGDAAGPAPLGPPRMPEAEPEPLVLDTALPGSDAEAPAAAPAPAAAAATDPVPLDQFPAAMETELAAQAMPLRVPTPAMQRPAAPIRTMAPEASVARRTKRRRRSLLSRLFLP